MKTLLILIIVIATVLTAACSSSSTPSPSTTTPISTGTFPDLKPVPDGFTLYTQEQNLFRIAFPLEWEKQPAVEPPGYFVAGIPSEGRWDYMPTVGVGASQWLENVLSLSVWVEDMVNGLEEALMGMGMAAKVELNDLNETTVNGIPSASADYTVTIGDEVKRYLQRFVPDGEVVWLVGCTSYEEEFAEYENTFRQILDSFQRPS